MRKGNTVRLNIDRCFTTKNGGQREFPLSNGACDTRGIIMGHRHTTHEERDDWRKHMAEEIRSGREVWHDCAGEPRMAPRSYSVTVNRDVDYTVVRARCCPTIGYHKQPGMALIKRANPETELQSKEFYVKRELLEVVGA
jgi:hypothetical protein